MTWRPIRFFLLRERPAAERAARRVEVATGRPVRIERCSGRGLRLMVGEDERREQRPVQRDRRRPT